MVTKKSSLQRNIIYRNHKKVFIAIFFAFSLMMIILPFLVTANDILTKILEKNLLYSFIQNHIVPLEAKMMGAILMFFGYKYAFSSSNSIILINGLTMEITWNCLGWQSFLLLFVTLLVGFRGKYKTSSVLEGLGIGILGTFWLNIGRMLFTILLAVHAPPIFRIVFHDYLAAATTVLWLFAYWWFLYSFVLEEKRQIISIKGQ